jgi:hypothetical protein
MYDIDNNNNNWFIVSSIFSAAWLDYQAPPLFEQFFYFSRAERDLAEKL